MKRETRGIGLRRAVLMVVGLVAGGSAQAAVLVTKGSGDFEYLYEMGLNPSGLDLDSNGTGDWFAGVAGGFQIPQTYVGGVGFSEQPSRVLFRTDFGGSLQRNIFSGVADPFTIELRIRKEGGASGGAGWFGLALQPVGASQSLRLNVGDSGFSFNGGAVNPIATGGNLGDYITVRVAYDGNNEWYAWRNGVLLNDSLADPFVGSNGSFNAGGGWFIGDFTGNIAGDWSIDYLRVGVGAFAIPEPGRAGLLLGGICLLLARRSRA